MDIVLLTKRGVAFQRIKRGEQTVFLIPSNENIKIYKDVADTATIGDRYGASGQVPLWRQHEGQTVVYGVLPESLAQRRQSIKVHLAQDFAPATTNAFYYVMDPKWIVHGRKEVNDEGRDEWRVTLLKTKDNQTPTMVVREAVAELMVENAESRTTVAVYENLDLYQELKDALQPFDIQPVPFTTLKVSPRTKPLYRQIDFTPLMLLGFLLAVGLLGAAIFYWLIYWRQAAQLDAEMETVRSQIVNVQINKSIGDIREPENMLASMEKAFNQKPSAIMNAAAMYGKEFGELEGVMFNTNDTTTSRSAGGLRAVTDKQHLVRVLVAKPTNTLLVDQERLARILLEKAPWVRRVENIPQGQSELTIDLVLQTENDQEGAVP